MGYRSLIMLAAWLVATASVHAEALTGRVVGISDGETLTILDASRERHRIRISGIDAPEKRQTFGERSRQNLANLAFQKDARLECHKTDRNKRKICKVWVQPPDCRTCDMTLDVGLAQVSTGLAWWYREYAKEQKCRGSRALRVFRERGPATDTRAVAKQGTGPAVGVASQ